jgi:hypothetical protein
VTTDEKIDRLTDAVLAQSGNLDELRAVVNTLANSVVAHDAQIGALISTAERHERIWQDLQQQWQAYLNTLPRQ